MALVKIEIEFDRDGNATITIPHGKNQARNAQKAASFTDQLSKALGEVTERHIGDHDHTHGEHTHTHKHLEA